MSVRPHHHPLITPGLTLCALATTGMLAFAQEPVPKSSHADDAPVNTNSSQGPPAVSRYGRFLVGDAAPDVDLRDQSNRRFHLSTARREKPWLLVFARTPDDVLTVEAVDQQLESLGIGVVAIAPFRRDRVRPLVAEPRVRLLTDGASITARNYGVFDAVTSNPRPALYLIDRSGKILMLMSGGFPGDGELVRLTRESLERAGLRAAEPPAALN
jgi:peroxiredoxin